MTRSNDHDPAHPADIPAHIDSPDGIAIVALDMLISIVGNNDSGKAHAIPGLLDMQEQVRPGARRRWAWWAISTLTRQAAGQQREYWRNAQYLINICRQEAERE
jgi:hypothetical protein